MGDKPKRRFDLNDAICGFGLALLCGGLWMVYPPAAPIVGGGFIVIVCICNAMLKARG